MCVCDWCDDMKSIYFRSHFMFFSKEGKIENILNFVYDDKKKIYKNRN